MSCINKVYERQAQKQNNPQPLSCAVVTRNTDVYKNQQIQQLTELLQWRFGGLVKISI